MTILPYPTNEVAVVVKFENEWKNALPTQRKSIIFELAEKISENIVILFDEDPIDKEIYEYLEGISKTWGKYAANIIYLISHRIKKEGLISLKRKEATIKRNQTTWESSNTQEQQKIIVDLAWSIANSSDNLELLNARIANIGSLYGIYSDLISQLVEIELGRNSKYWGNTSYAEF